MQHRIIITFLFSIISLICFGQADQHHRTYETTTDTIFNHMESTTSTGDVISIGFRQFENDQQTLILATLDAKGNINWQKEIDFGRDTTTLVGLAKIDLNSTQDSILFTCLADINGNRKEIFGKCDKAGGACVVRTIEGGDDSEDYPNIAAFIDSTEILLKSGKRPTIARIGLGDDLIWSRIYNFIDGAGDTVQSQVTDILGTIDSTILLADNSSEGNFLLAELDSNGVQLWAENYAFQVPGMTDPFPHQVIKLNNMSSAVVGRYGTNNADDNGFVMVVDTFGTPILTRQVLVDGNPTDMKNVLQAEDGSLWMSGAYMENDSSYYFTTNMTIDGIINWTTIYPGVLVGNEDTTADFTSLRAVEMGGAFLAGHALDDAGLTMLNVMKHNEMGETPCSDTISVSLVDISVTTDTLFSEETIENGGLFFNTIEVEIAGTNILSPPTLSIVDAYQFCPNEPIDTVLVAVVSGVSEITYQWGDENGVLPEFDDSLRIIKEGQYSVTVTIGEDVCYQMCDTIEVTRTNLPMPMIGLADLTQCSNGAIDFENLLSVTDDQGQAPFEYIWSTNETTDLISVTQGGAYSVSVTDQCGDMATANTEVIVPLFNPIASINSSSPCNNEEVNLTATYSGGVILFPNLSQDLTYIWSSGETVPGIIVTEAGTYTVTISDACGSSLIASETVNFDIVTEATISFETNCDEETPSNSTVTFSVESNQNDAINIFLTKIEDGNPSLIGNPLDPQVLANYNMQVTNICGDLLDSLSVSLVGICDPAPFAFPKVFFPGNRNESTEFTFGPIPNSGQEPMESDTLNVLERISNIEFKVFNRWGEEVYTVDSEDNSAFSMPWDGTHKGDPAPSEVYIWYFSYTLDKDTPGEKTDIAKGDVTLVR
ncbi:MAG: hypothetical protein ACJATI_001286 [Halioglobus sp.]|jgi:hypothetical protein